jgi:hypothetical protein
MFHHHLPRADDKMVDHRVLKLIFKGIRIMYQHDELCTSDIT